ncbi:tetrapyrrole methylase [Spinellus fusiger]|nr:tetrapyrrole methylase [Spinellus fusiger]
MTVFLPNVPTPQGGTSLMIAYQCQQKNVLVVGTSTIAANRCLAALEANATVYLIGDTAAMGPELLYRIDHHQVQWIGSQWVDPVQLQSMSLVFVCDPHDSESIVAQCRACRVPVNVTDRNDLCDFFMTSTYRDQSLQIAVSTNGQASKLSNRVQRHIAGSLPPHLGDAIRRVGVLRRKVKDSDPNAFAKSRRMKWLAQICEYWSMERLSQLSDQDMEDLLETYHQDEGYESVESHWEPPRARKQQGSIALVGAGLGHPDLLTMAAHKAIASADLVLADKIVPPQVVDLVKCELKIARKFPGNADAAQDEFNALALSALQQGKRVVRLKQGDPFLFGRGGEEVQFFRQHGYSTELIPGISSTVAASLLAGIPLTHRAVASQFLVTTGTGRKNSSVPLPVYDSSRSDVFLMSIHRLADLTHDLIHKQSYPPTVPCAIIERAGCADQRVVWSPLESIVQVLESVGGSRPPGLLVVGHSVDVLKLPSHGKEGVAATLNTIERTIGTKNVLSLHDPEGVY